MADQVVTDRMMKWAEGLSHLSLSVNTNSDPELLWTVNIPCKKRRFNVTLKLVQAATENIFNLLFKQSLCQRCS